MSPYSGLQIHDVSDPANPVFMGELPELYALGMEVDSPYLVTTSAGVIKVVDVSVPATPQVVFELPMEIDDDTLGYLAIHGNWLYIGSGSGIPSEVNIVDLTNPEAPITFSSEFVSQLIGGMEISGHNLIGNVYDEEEHVLEYTVLDISDPSEPILSGYYPLPWGASTALVRNGYAYLKSRYWVDVLDLSIVLGSEQDFGLPISSFTLHSAYPNPFNGVTTIRFELPRSVPVVYDVFNALGQQVTSRDLGVLNGGEQRVSLDANGWGSGSYWVRLQAGADVLGTKIVLLK
jgi:hypothetical protein